MVKVTFTLDDATVEAIRAVAERRKKPQSLVVREAVAVYLTQDEKLSEHDRQRKLQLLDRLKSRSATRSPDEVDAELREVRRGRRAGWRRPAE